MTLAANITKLAVLGATISGVRNSFDLDATPTALQPAMLPALMFFPDGGKVKLDGFNDLYEIDHRVRIQVAYAAASQGSLARNVDGTVAILDALIVALRTDDTLTGSCASARVTGYSRLGEFSIGNVDYIGIEVTVEVLEYLG